MRNNLIRYILGFILGILIMEMGRYKIHGWQPLVVAGIVVYTVFDLIKSKIK